MLANRPQHRLASVGSYPSLLVGAGLVRSHGKVRVRTRPLQSIIIIITDAGASSRCWLPSQDKRWVSLDFRVAGGLMYRVVEMKSL